MNRSLLLLAIVFLIAPQTTSAARLWSTGCEFQSDEGGNKSARQQLEFTEQVSTTSPADITIYTTTKHSGDSSCRFRATSDGRAFARNQFLAAQTSASTTHRFYFYLITAPTEDTPIYHVWDRGVDSWEGGIILETDRQLHWRDDDFTLDGQGTTVLSLNTWYRIELDYNDVTGATVYVDGVSELNAGAHDGDAVDSMGITLCSEDTVTCGVGNLGQGEYLFDDIAVNDTSGGSQTGLPGEGNIVYMQPNAAGDSNGCSAGDSTSIDELTPDDATTICVLDADTGGDVIDANVESSSNAGIDSQDTITLVLVGIRAAGATAVSNTYNTRIKSASGGTTSNGTSMARTTTTYTTNGHTGAGVTGAYSLASYTDPTTGIAWTPTGTNSLDNMQIGANASDGNPDVNVSTVWALVEYKDVAAAATSNPQSLFKDAMMYWKDAQVYFRN